MKRIIIAMLAFIILASMLTFAKSDYRYIPDVNPHTRYNMLLAGCYYYYGYGSCIVPDSECVDTTKGMNRLVNLGDACKRNAPPTIENAHDITAMEGTLLTIDVKCVDDDPVFAQYSGWTTTKQTLAGFLDSGVYDETVSCVDSFGATASANIKITILDFNRPPLFRMITRS